MERSIRRIPTISYPKNILFLSPSSQRVPQISDDNPFDILGIPKTSSYKQVKSRFVELALANHPDTSQNRDSSNFTYACDNRSRALSNLKLAEQRNENINPGYLKKLAMQDVLFRIDLATRKLGPSTKRSCLSSQHTLPRRTRLRRHVGNGESNGGARNKLTQKNNGLQWGVDKREPR